MTAGTRTAVLTPRPDAGDIRVALLSQAGLPEQRFRMATEDVLGDLAIEAAVQRAAGLALVIDLDLVPLHRLCDCWLRTLRYCVMVLGARLAGHGAARLQQQLAMPMVLAGAGGAA